MGMKNGDDSLDDECVRDVVDVIERDSSVDGQLDRSGAMMVTHKYEQDTSAVYDHEEESKHWKINKELLPNKHTKH